MGAEMPVRRRRWKKRQLVEKDVLGIGVAESNLSAVSGEFYLPNPALDLLDIMLSQLSNIPLRSNRDRLQLPQLLVS